MTAHPQTPERLVVVGAGMAGMRTVEELLKRVQTRPQITVFAGEPHPNYDRIQLSSVLAGEKSLDDIVLHPVEWCRDHGVDLRLNDPVVSIDRAAKTVTSASGVVQPYDKLLVATGSNPIILPLPGKDLAGVRAFRDIADTLAMIEASETKQHAVVIGGGLLGLEAANGLRNRGMAVSVVHLMPWIMERQLDSLSGDLLRQELEVRGVAFHTGAQTEALLDDGKGHVRAVKLKDGTEIPADLVILAVGIRPNTDLAKAAGLSVGRGIQVDDDMRTSDPAIFAVGECVEHRQTCYGLVAPIWDMAKVIAAQLSGDAEAAYHGSETATKLKVTGVDLFSAGRFDESDGAETVVVNDAARGRYRKLVFRDGKLDGVILYGDAADSGWYMDMIRSRADVSEKRDLLVFGESVVNLISGGASLAPNLGDLPDSAEICGCNGVCKGTILKAVAEKGLTTLDEVKAHTKASASCGQCSGKVASLLQFALGDSFVAAPAEKPICKCTDHTHDEVRHRIVADELKTIPEVMKALGWKTETGCHVCRPALNYYLLCAWPEAYEDDIRSRFINERAHANIQKDGTYSVIPRMWGGQSNPRELRALADVSEKYNLKTVKITGGQRIALYGAKKEDLPAIWAELNDAGMVSGHAYGKALRTVKTCVGSTWCRFGTQDSLGLGERMEKLSWGMWAPHKVKLAVSACPRNCAEATIKDFGIICHDSGYELHIAGNGGIDLRGTDVLCKVATEEEVMEYYGAFIQLYREDGRYLERTAPWVERRGLDYVKHHVVEDETNRKALYQRFLHSQKYAQIDPWAEVVAGKDADEFKPLADLSAAAAE